MEPRNVNGCWGRILAGRKDGRRLAAMDSGEKHLCSCIRKSESLVESNKEERHCN
jgi:hypothetical protein